MKNIFVNTSLVIIILVGLFFRLHNLAKNPVGFFCDEAERGVSAYSIILTGKDWHGDKKPIFFKAFGEYTPPLQTYSMIIPIKIFGLNEFSVRLTSVFWGIISIIAIFFIGRFFGSSYLALSSAFFLAIEPWSLHYSRYGAEITVYLSFFLISLALSLQALKNKRFYPLAFFSWGLTLYSYNPAKLIVPIFIIIFLIIDKKNLKTKTINQIKIGFIFFILTSVPFLIHMFSGSGFIRFQQVSYFFKDVSLFEKVSVFFIRYLIQFSPSYLFFKGDPTFITRHFTSGMSPLLIIQSFLISLGLIKIFLQKKYLPILLSWIIIYPLAGALTEYGPLTSRSIIGAPLFALLSAFGLKFLIEFFKKKILTVRIISLLIISLSLLNFSYFYYFYMNKYPQKSADFWG